MDDGRFQDFSSPVWRKSSHSTAQGEECVEVAQLSPAMIGIRDSKDPVGPRISLTIADWQSVIHRAKFV